MFNYLRPEACEILDLLLEKSTSDGELQSLTVRKHLKTLTGFGVLISTALFAAQPAVTNTPADFMIQNFLKAEAARGARLCEPRKV